MKHFSPVIPNEQREEESGHGQTKLFPVTRFLAFARNDEKPHDNVTPGVPCEP